MTNEQALLMALTGTAELAAGATFTPQNNAQAYLAYAVGLLTDPNALPEPRTPEEILLREVALIGVGGYEGELPELTNPASAALILATYEAINSRGIKMTGTMPNNGSVTKNLDADTQSVTIAKGYHDGTGKVSVAVEEKTATPATAAQAVEPAAGKLLSKVTVEAVPVQQKTVTPGTAEQTVEPDAGKFLDEVKVEGDANLVASNIKKGTKIFGVTGTLETEGGGGVVLPTVENPADADEILAGKQMLDGSGNLVTGKMENNGSMDETLDLNNTYVIIPEGYHDGGGMVHVETEVKEVTPTSKDQEITPTDGYLLARVLVKAAESSGAVDCSLKITDCNSLFRNGARISQFQEIMTHVPYISNAQYMFEANDFTTFSFTADDPFWAKLAKCNGCRYMFKGTKASISVPDITFENDNWVEYMFQSATGLKDVGVLSFPSIWNGGFDYMFSGAAYLTTVGGITLGNGAAQITAGNMFQGCSALASVGELNFKPTSAGNMFSGCSSLTEAPELDLSECSSMNSMYMYCTGLKGAIVLGPFKATNVSNIFYGCTNITEILNFHPTTTGNMTGSNCFPQGSASAPAALNRLTFSPDCAFTGFSGLSIKYCSFDRNGMVEFFNSLPNLSNSSASSTYKQITITGNPCVTDGTLTDEDKAIATDKGWTLVI